MEEGFCRIDKSWPSLNICDGIPRISGTSNRRVGRAKRAAHGSGTSRWLVLVQIFLVNYFSGCLLAPLVLAPLLEFIFQLFSTILLSHRVQNYIKVTQRLNNGHRDIHLAYHNLPQADAKRAYNELHRMPNIIFNKIIHAIALRQIWHEHKLLKILESWNDKTKYSTHTINNTHQYSLRSGMIRDT